MTERSKKSATGPTEASVVVPTFREVGNIEQLTKRVYAALQENQMENTTEIIIVDDNSRDGTEELVNKLASEGYPVRVIVRTTERGLSSAVLRGFNEAQGELLLCMDADLQHPPEKVPEMLQAIDAAKSGAEFAIGTRYAADEFVVDENWPLYRQVVSKGARLMARPLTPLSDPMTGFFSIRREAYRRARNVNSIGFKICLELYVKSEIRKHAEVPIMFGVRTVGESKLSGKVIINYLKQLQELYLYKHPILSVAAVLLAIIIFFYIVSFIFS
ncbi:dolichol phosphate beta-d-mannosyltransferase-like protein [Basidiobolus meristosporus CBS 931.73]|uniref:Dolichol-phosphate mannosyltransferase subunit 1 n=1 Tax=Basidiobolus meristosporus CBS 931.73 TaxID=1314790 RepID=A0A1Y1YDU3_9FUNG|nr:dolichol phosphate beta-d-mannosyltransferase-like protein [Basidiobolus meristosporus CBS 931.73]|eukprot:ORX96115.1 dolichol phosphate beta-d-mannosyltransferase-like protein [Basidiobolus meristosporus CBS 931.73]